MSNDIRLQFLACDIRALAERYEDEDEKMLEAGKNIVGGRYTRENLKTIFLWKTNGRGQSRLVRNTDAEIEDALRLADNAKTERAAIGVLCGLDGVGVPVASAIMTAVKPEVFTVIDFRALESLDVTSYTMGVDLYLAYLQACRKLSSQNQVSLRVLDRALWQWSNERGSRRKER
jgi:hypothetical protein